MNEDFERRVADLEFVDVFFVDAFATVVAVWVVDAFSVVDGRAGCAGGEVAVASAIHVNIVYVREIHAPCCWEERCVAHTSICAVYMLYMAFCQ